MIDCIAGYHLNPMAPHRYKVSSDAAPLTIDPQNGSRSLKSPTLPIRIPVRAAANGTSHVNASFTFVYCREDNTGVCRIKTLKWNVPVEISSDPNAPTEITLNAKVTVD